MLLRSFAVHRAVTQLKRRLATLGHEQRGRKRGQAVDIRVLGTASAARRATRLGVRRLLLLNTTPTWKRLLSLLTTQQKLQLGHNPHGSVPALLDDALACAVEECTVREVGGSLLGEHTHA